MHENHDQDLMEVCFVYMLSKDVRLRQNSVSRECADESLYAVVRGSCLPTYIAYTQLGRVTHFIESHLSPPYT